MLGYRVHRRTAWMAIVAVLLNAFAPLVAHAMPSTHGGAWVDVCTTDGITRIDVADGHAATGGAPVNDVTGGHCPYCVPHGTSAGLAPVPPLSVPVVPGPDAAATAVDPLPLALPLWAANQARAPPLAH